VGYRVRVLHLSSEEFSVDVRYVRLRGRWLASADTPAGPSVGCGDTAFAAQWMALAPYQDVVDSLLASLPDWELTR
jgi:hypothetical protein